MNEPIPEAVRLATTIESNHGRLNNDQIVLLISSAMEEYAKRVIADKLSIAMQQLQQQLAETQAISAAANKTYEGVLKQLAALQKERDELKRRLEVANGDYAIEASKLISLRADVKPLLEILNKHALGTIAQEQALQAFLLAHPEFEQ